MPKSSARIQDLMLSLVLPHLEGEDRLHALSLAMVASAVESYGPSFLRGVAASMADTLTTPGMLDATLDQVLRVMAAQGRPIAPEVMRSLQGLREMLTPMVDALRPQSDTAMPFPAGTQYDVPHYRPAGPMPPRPPVWGHCADRPRAGACPDENCDDNRMIPGPSGERWSMLTHRLVGDYVIQRFGLLSVVGREGIALVAGSVRCYVAPGPVSNRPVYHVTAMARSEAGESMPVTLHLYFGGVGDGLRPAPLAVPLDNEAEIAPHAPTSDPPEVCVEAHPTFGCVIVARKRYAKVAEIPVKIAEDLTREAPSTVARDPFVGGLSASGSGAPREIAVMVKGVSPGARVMFRGEDISDRPLPNGSVACRFPDAPGTDTETRVFGFPYNPSITQEFAVVGGTSPAHIRFSVGLTKDRRGLLWGHGDSGPRIIYDGEWMEFSANVFSPREAQAPAHGPRDESASMAPRYIAAQVRRVPAGGAVLFQGEDVSRQELPGGASAFRKRYPMRYGALPMETCVFGFLFDPSVSQEFTVTDARGVRQCGLLLGDGPFADGPIQNDRDETVYNGEYIDWVVLGDRGHRDAGARPEPLRRIACVVRNVPSTARVLCGEDEISEGPLPNGKPAFRVQTCGDFGIVRETRVFGLAYEPKGDRKIEVRDSSAAGEESRLEQWTVSAGEFRTGDITDRTGEMIYRGERVEFAARRSEAAREIAVMVHGVSVDGPVMYEGEDIGDRPLPNGALAWTQVDSAPSTGTRVFGFSYDPNITQEFFVTDASGGRRGFIVGMGRPHAGDLVHGNVAVVYRGEWMEFFGTPEGAVLYQQLRARP